MGRDLHANRWRAGIRDDQHSVQALSAWLRVFPVRSGRRIWGGIANDNLPNRVLAVQMAEQEVGVLKTIRSVLILTVLSALAIACLLPIYWMVKGSFETMGSVMKIPPSFIVRTPTLGNYTKLIFNYPVLRWTLNSVIVTLSVTGISVLVSCLAGYAFAKKEFPGKQALFWALLMTMMVPFYTILIPRFIWVKQLGLYNSYLGMILPLVYSAGGIFLARQYMSTLSSELIDAAKIDGASELQTFLYIIVPICKPLIAVLSIFCFMGNWSNFLWPLIITSSTNMRTLPIGIVMAATLPGELVDIGVSMAGATLVALPMFVVFICFQKYFIKGITIGGVKG